MRDYGRYGSSHRSSTSCPASSCAPPPRSRLASAVRIVAEKLSVKRVDKSLSYGQTYVQNESDFISALHRFGIGLFVYSVCLVCL